MTCKVYKRLLAGTVAAIAMLPASASAQSDARAPDAEAGEIVVTATRRAELLSKVPISATAMSQDSLDDRGVRSIADLQRVVPGVVFEPGLANIAIRGVSSSGGASTTGVYIDETPIQLLNIGTAAVNAVPAIYDLDRVEVLRGPQGTLFGAGAEGGVVRYITPQPKLEGVSGNAQVELGFIENGSPDYQVNAALGAPLVEGKIGFRVSGFYRKIGGWIDRLDYRDYSVAERDFNDGEVAGGRIAVKFAPSESFSITPSFMMQHRTGQGESGGLSIFTEYWSNPKQGIFRSSIAQPTLNKDDWYLPSVKMEWSLGSVDLVSNSSYFSRKQSTGYSGIEYMTSVYNTLPGLMLPTVPYPLVTEKGVRLPLANYAADAVIENKQSNFTQEIRLQSSDSDARLTWVVGGYYQHNRGTNVEYIRDPNMGDLTQALFGLSAVDFWGLPLINDDESYRGAYHTLDEQLAVFGQLDFDVTDRLTLTVGARVSRNKFSFENEADGPVNGGPTTAEGSQKETPFTPKIGASFEIDSNNMVYASYARGYRIGGANAPVPAAACSAGFAQLGITETPGEYTSDTTDSYEIGSKNRLFDGKLQVATSAYHIKWDGIQQAVTVPVCGYVYIDNLGKAESNGFDLQLQARPAEGLTLDVAFGYTDAQYTSTIAAGASTFVRDGNSLGGPEWTLAVGGQYDFAAFQKPAFVRFDWQHASRQKGLTSTQDPLVPNRYDGTIPVPPASDYVTMRTGVTLDQLQLALFVDNLLNSSEILRRSHRTRTWPAFGDTSWRPRTFSVIATYKF